MTTTPPLPPLPGHRIFADQHLGLCHVYTAGQMTEYGRLCRESAGQGDMPSPDWRLPCDVRVAPATTIGKGCSFSTLVHCLQDREGGGPTIEVDKNAFRGAFPATAPASPSLEVEALSEFEDILVRLNGQLIDSQTEFDWKIIVDYHDRLREVFRKLATAQGNGND